MDIVMLVLTGLGILLVVLLTGHCYPLKIKSCVQTRKRRCNPECVIVSKDVSAQGGIPLPELCYCIPNKRTKLPQNQS